MSERLTTDEALAVAAAGMDHLLAATPGRRIVGVVGPPGTGKSTFAQRLVQHLGARSAYLPMDGYHLSNRQLDRLGRRDRKGAPDTFDVDGYVSALRRVSTGEADVYVPDFDRALDESVAAGLVVPVDARVVVTEGNYLALTDGAWAAVRGEVDRLYYLDCPVEIRRARLIARHVAGGRSRLAAQRWVDSVDEPNAAVIARTEPNCDSTLFVDAPR